MLVINLERAAVVGDSVCVGVPTLFASPSFLSDSLSSLVSITRGDLRLLEVGDGPDFERIGASAGCFLGELISFDKVGSFCRRSISLLVAIIAYFVAKVGDVLIEMVLDWDGARAQHSLIDVGGKFRDAHDTSSATINETQTRENILTFSTLLIAPEAEQQNGNK